jgi:hypothetical protein
MLNRNQLFEYDASDYIAGEKRVVAEVPAGIITVEKLFVVLVQVLRLPSYFGFNWNALSDCLRDFHWIPEREIVLVHRDVPALPLAELTTYLAVLAEACQSWQPGEEHVLRVIFPDGGRPEVIRRLGETS